MSTAEGRSRPRLNDAADTKKLRRYFIGGSDARIIMGDDEGALLRLYFTAFFPPEPDEGGFIIAHDDPGVRAADEVAPEFLGIGCII